MQSSELVVASLSCAELGTAQPQLVVVVMAVNVKPVFILVVNNCLSDTS